MRFCLKGIHPPMRTVSFIQRWRLCLSLLMILFAGCASKTASHPTASPTPTLTPIPTPANVVVVTSTPTPLPPGTPPALDPTSEKAIDRIIAKMSLDEKIGQMLMIEYPYPTTANDLVRILQGTHAGSLIFYTYYGRSMSQMQTLTATANSASTLPPLLAIDQEGGDVDRLAQFFGPSPSGATLGATNNPQKAQAEGVLTAQRLAQLGINVDLAPVVDVGTQEGSLDGTRLWGDDPDQVAKMTSAYVDGLQQNGILATLKHWPGIGSLPYGSDPHKVLPVLDRSINQMNATDFKSFQDLLENKPAMIMTTHVIVPSIDPKYPASLSPKLVDGVLRGQLGYQGVIITDQLHMGAIIANYSLNEASVLAILAGNDIIEGAYDYNTAMSMEAYIHAAVQNGRISAERIDDSVRRILEMKWRYHIGIDKMYSVAGPDPVTIDDPRESNHP